MLPIIHPHPPNRKTTRNDETPKYSPPQQHSTLTRTSPCTTHETNPTPTEYRNPLTHNNIQNTQKTSLITPPHDPAPLPHTTQPEHPAGTQKRRRPTHPQQPPQGHAITAGQTPNTKSPHTNQTPPTPTSTTQHDPRDVSSPQVKSAKQASKHAPRNHGTAVSCQQRR